MVKMTGTKQRSRIYWRERGGERRALNPTRTASVGSHVACNRISWVRPRRLLTGVTFILSCPVYSPVEVQW